MASLRQQDDPALTVLAEFVTGLISPVVYAALSAAFFPLTMYCAWCDMHLWNWFAAPYFHLPVMSFWVALGVGLWLRLQLTPVKVVKGEETRIWYGLCLLVSMHAISLLIGYLIHAHAAVRF